MTSVRANTVLSDDDGSLTVHTSVVERSSTTAGPAHELRLAAEPQSQVMTGQAQVGGVVVSSLEGDIGKRMHLNAGQDA